MIGVRVLLPLLVVVATILLGCQTAPTADAGNKGSPAPVAAVPESAPSVNMPQPMTESTSQPTTPEPNSSLSEAVMTTQELQQRLTNLGYKPGPIDGLLGQRTITALKKFQRDRHIPATGKLDPETINVLGKP